MVEKDYESILRQKEEGNSTDPGENVQHSGVGGTQFIFVNYSYYTGWHLNDRHHFLDSERRRRSWGAERPQGVRPCRRSTSCHACAGVSRIQYLVNNVLTGTGPAAWVHYYRPLSPGQSKRYQPVSYSSRGKSRCLLFSSACLH